MDELNRPYPVINETPESLARANERRRNETAQESRRSPLSIAHGSEMGQGSRMTLRQVITQEIAEHERRVAGLVALSRALPMELPYEAEQLLIEALIAQR